jgi:hypothetical protein
MLETEAADPDYTPDCGELLLAVSTAEELARTSSTSTTAGAEVRSAVTVLALLATCVLVPITLTTTWLRSDVIAPSGYVDTVGTIASSVTPAR